MICRFCDRAKDGASAANRGLPSNPSQAVMADMKKIADLERQYGQREWFGFTHISYEEFVTADFQKLGGAKIEDSEWGLVVAIIENVRARYYLAGFRIVCWAGI